MKQVRFHSFHKLCKFKKKLLNISQNFQLGYLDSTIAVVNQPTFIYTYIHIYPVKKYIKLHSHNIDVMMVLKYKHVPGKVTKTIIQGKLGNL